MPERMILDRATTNASSEWTFWLRLPGRALVTLARAVDLAAPLWFVPIGLALLFPSDYRALGVMALAALYLARGLARGFPIPLSRGNLTLLVLLGAVCVGFIISSARDAALTSLLQVLLGVSIYFRVVERAQTTDSGQRSASVLVLLGVAVALATPFVANWTKDKMFSLPRFYDAAWPRWSETANPNILAGAIAPIFMLAWGLARSSRWTRYVGALALAPLGMILVLLQSRAALTSVGVGIALWLAVRHRWSLPLVPLAVLALLYANSFIGVPVPIKFNAGVTAENSYESLSGREAVWRKSLSLISQAPLFGIGLGAYPRAAQTEPFALQAGPDLDHAHNLFLQVALDSGLIGLAGMVALFGFSLGAVWRAYRAQVNAPLALGLLTALVVLMTHGLLDTIVWNSKASFVLWFLLGIGAAFDKKG